MNTNLPLTVSDLITDVTPVIRISLTTSGKEIKYIDFGKDSVLVLDQHSTNSGCIEYLIKLHNLTIGYGCIMKTLPYEYRQAMLKLKNELIHFPVKQVKTAWNTVYKLDYGIKP